MDRALKISKLQMSKETFGNFIAALLWCFYLFHSGKEFVAEGKAIFLLLLFRNSLIVILFLIRREAKSVSKNPLHWVVALITTTFAFAFTTSGTRDLVLPLISNSLFIFGATLACYAVFNLGRSFGIAPAHRGIVTNELYGYIRHPMYTSYILMDCAILLSAFSWPNLFIFLSLLILFYVRAAFEEEFLKKDPTYETYCQKVRFKFVPGIL